MEILPTRQELIDAFTHLFTMPHEKGVIAFGEIEDKETFIKSNERIADKVLNFIKAQREGSPENWP